MKTSISWPMTAKLVNGHVLGRSICNDTCIPISISVPGPIGDWGWEHLHLQSVTQI